MSSDVLEPAKEDATEPAPHREPPPSSRPTPGLDSSASGDELSAILTHAAPDPLLGEFVSEPGSGPEPKPGDAPAVEPATPGVPAGIGAEGDEDAAVRSGLSVSSSEALAGLDLAAPPASPPAARRTATDDPSGSDDDEHDDEPPRGSAVGVMLLASYASAVTLGLLWVLWTGRRLPESSGVEDATPTQSVDVRADPGVRADRSRKIEPPPPIPADHLTTLGKTIRLGQLEITPLSVSAGPVRLERSFEGHQTKSGGDDALWLRLRLRNVSKDLVFAPLDEAFLRDRPGADPDSSIETSSSTGAAPIGQFPLAVQSEWSIVGQEFRELRPGDSFESAIVSAPDALARKAPQMTWRIRLRTDLDRTEILGVRFRESDIGARLKGKTK